MQCIGQHSDRDGELGVQFCTSSYSRGEEAIENHKFKTCLCYRVTSVKFGKLGKTLSHKSSLLKVLRM